MKYEIKNEYFAIDILTKLKFSPFLREITSQNSFKMARYNIHYQWCDYGSIPFYCYLAMHIFSNLEGFKIV